MGGCRCIFRDCNVCTARQPRMHFFRFPLKDPERLLRWIEMADVPYLRDLPPEKQKNRVVCARHFRDECFMNYKKDKLVSKAVPTLDRLKGGYAIDYAAEGSPQIILLPPPSSPYMIPPPGFECPLHLEDITLAFVEEVPQPEDVAEFIPQQSQPTKKRKAQALTTVVPSSRTKLLNTEAPVNDQDEASASSTDAFISKFVEFVDTPNTPEVQQENYVVCLDESYDDLSIEFVSQEAPEESESVTFLATHKDAEVQTDSTTMSSKSQKFERMCEDYEQQLKKERLKFTAQQEESSKQIMQLVDAVQTTNRDVEVKSEQLEKLTSTSQKQQETIKQLQARNEELESEIESLGISNGILNARLEALTDEHRNVLKLKQQLEARNFTLEQQQVSTVSTSVEALAVPSTNALASISKAQLFNGIKRYLSSSMIALVRMEMFGSAERQWKPDEKQAAMDLLRLGENVYNYITDEWRFRLPSIRQVHGWMNEDLQTHYEDEDL